MRLAWFSSHVRLLCTGGSAQPQSLQTASATNQSGWQLTRNLIKHSLRLQHETTTPRRQHHTLDSTEAGCV